MGGFGTQTNALAAGGIAGTGVVATTESWNGTSWTEVNDINTARRQLSAAGEYTSGLIFGGGPPYVAITESWNGVSWVEVADLSTARAALAPAGSATAGLAFGGTTGSVTAATEEWSSSSNVIKVITTS